MHVIIILERRASKFNPTKNTNPLVFSRLPCFLVEKSYSVPEKECSAVMLAFQTQRPYLQCGQFIVHLDQASLRWPVGVTGPSGKLMRWKLLLRDFASGIVFKTGISNVQEDALSQLMSSGHTQCRLTERYQRIPRTQHHR